MVPSNPTSDATQTGSPQAKLSQAKLRSRQHFPPVALPALAAAVHVAASAARSARIRQAARQRTRIVHEDEPAL